MRSVPFGLKAAILTGVLLLLGGCGLVDDGGRYITPVDAPPNDYFTPTWVGDDLVVGIAPLLEARIWRLSLEAGRLEMVDLPEESGCNRYGIIGLELLPDGRIGYLAKCILPNKVLLTWELRMRAWDPKTGVVTPLRTEPLPSGAVGTGGYSWNPEMTRAVTSDGSGLTIEEQLYWFTPDDWVPLDVGLPQAYFARWSPDGRVIAFIGAPEQGLTGRARLGSDRNPYLIDPDGSNQRVLVEGFRAGGTLWSPDGRWLVLTAEFGGFIKQRGLWLVDAETGERHLVTSRPLAVVSWSSDGRRLATSDRTKWTEESPTTPIVIVEIGEFIDQLAS